MPELPDITLYADALRAHVVGRVLERVSIRSPALLRTFDPPIDEATGRVVTCVERRGKRLVLVLGQGEGAWRVVIHLMIAGRLLWKAAGAKPNGKIDQAAFAFGPSNGDAGGTLVLTEASTQKRATVHLFRDRRGMDDLGVLGLDVLACTLEEFVRAITRENRTLKRALTDPRTFDGIGNAYSDEILWAAGLSPLTLTGRLGAEACERLHRAARDTLTSWTGRLREEFGYDPATGASRTKARFPGVGDVTAFRPDFAVHGRFKKPCPKCGTSVQRIVRAENEFNYCPTCQTGGKVLADRSLSRLLKEDWPRTVEELEG